MRRRSVDSPRVPARPRAVLLLAAVVAAAAAMAACESLTQLVARETFSAVLTGRAVRPDSVVTGGSGTMTASVASNTSFMEYQLTFAGLSASATAAHIHGPAEDSASGPVLVDFKTLPAGSSGTLQLGVSGTASGSIDLARGIAPGVSGDSLLRLMHAGRLYVDVHTANNSRGEIRGQLHP